MIIDFIFGLISGVLNAIIGIIPDVPVMITEMDIYFDHFITIVVQAIGMLKLVFPSVLLNFLFLLMIFDASFIHVWKLVIFIYDRIPFKAS